MDRLRRRERLINEASERLSRYPESVRFELDRGFKEAELEAINILGSGNID